MRFFWNVISVLVVIGEVCCSPPSPCSLCPAGTFLEHACSPGADTQCLPCQEGTFSASANHQKLCSPCSECTEGMYMEKACQTVTDTLCAPCSSIPSVKSDFFIASCKLGHAEGIRADLEPEMLADAPENGEASANQDAHADHAEHEESNKDTAGKEYVPDSDNADTDNNHNDDENTKESNKEILENSSPVPDSSVKNFESHADLTDKAMNGIGKLDTNEADADKDQNNPENKLSEKANLPLQALEQGSEDTVDSTTLSTQEISSMNEARMGAVKLGDDEEENNSKKELNDEFNPTVFVPHIGKSRTSDHDVRGGQVNNTDGNVHDGTQADAPVGHKALDVHVDTLSDNMTDHHAENSNDTGGVLHSMKADSTHVTKEDPEGRKRAAIILGVAIAGMTLFALIFFASRCLRRTKRRKFKDMKKVNSYDQDSDEIQPLSYTATGSHEDPDAEEKHGLYRQGPPVGPSSPRKNPPKVEPSQPSEVQTVPEKSVTIPVLTVSPAQDDPPQEDLSESLSDHEPLVSDVSKLKYIDESTDDEYVMRVLNKIPFSRLSHVVEEPQVTHPSTQKA